MLLIIKFYNLYSNSKVFFFKLLLIKIAITITITITTTKTTILKLNKQTNNQKANVRNVNSYAFFVLFRFFLALQYLGHV